MHRIPRLLAPIVVCCVAATLAVLHAWSPQQPSFRAGIDLVAVDAHVVDASGHPVADLRPEEFTVAVDGKPRTIVAADYVAHDIPRMTISARAPAPARRFTSNAAAPAAAASRTILIVVDEENIANGSGRFAIDAAGAFLDRMQPDDRVGLLVLTGGNVAIDPTTDRAVIREALPRLTGRSTRDDASPYALGQVEAFSFLHDKNLWSDAVARECHERYDRLPKPACVSALEADATRMVSDTRRRQRDSMRALIALFEALADVPGPKTAVLLTQQLPVAPYLVEKSDFNAEARILADAAARARAHVYVLHLDTRAGGVEQSRQAGSPEADSDMASFGIETVATVTGGRRIMVSGKPEAAFERVALEISGHYVLGFRAEQAERDGKPHTIEISVKRVGAEVRAPRIFTYAPARASGTTSAADAVNRALRTATSESDIPMSVATYTGVEAAPSTRMRVIITAEIQRGVTKDTPLTIGYTITDNAGKNAGASVEQVTLKPAIGHPDGVLVYTAAALVPPGAYTLRMAVADATLRVGSVVHPFEARPTEAGAARLGEFVVFDRYPVEAGKGRPSVSATVTEALSGYIVAYARLAAAGGPDGVLNARLEIADTSDGPARAGADMTVQGPEADGRLRIAGTVKPVGLPTGDYVARVVLRSGSGLGQTIRPIRVVAPMPAAATATPSAPLSVAPGPAIAAATSSPSPAAVSPGGARRTPAAGIEDALHRVAAYIDNYAEQMSLVIGIEHYTQWQQREQAAEIPSASTYGTSAGRAFSRQLVSEFALVRNKSDWDGFRNVYEVDGKAVPEARNRFEKLFLEAAATAVEQSRKIAAESSRYNLGAMQRNFNVPTVALFFLTSANQGRFRFRKEKDENVNGLPAWKVTYQEVQKPTIIRTSAGKDMPVKGEVWVDPVDGRVLKTHLQIESEMSVGADMNANKGVTAAYADRERTAVRRVRTSASITVTYAVDSTLGILVPSEMRETYEAPMRNQFTGEDVMTTITGVATYAGFKRFETGARMVPPR